MDFSRTKAKVAQQGEVLILQPKEQIGMGQKMQNHHRKLFRWAVFFVCDDVLLQDNVLVLCESKHSKNALLPNSDDVVTMI